MKIIALFLLVASIVLTGCARSYVMKFNNGTQVTTPSKPKLKDGLYHFKDAKGREHTVAAIRVIEIAPASAEAKSANAQPMKR